MSTKHLSFGAHVKSAGDNGTLECIVSVFGNVDSYKERVMPGAFAASIARKMPRGVWAHDWEKPIAKTLECRELLAGDPMLPDELKQLGGLYVKAQFFPEIEDSWQSYLKIKNGLIDEYSIGYRLMKHAVNDETGVWDLLEIDLTEWSPVLKGANPATATLSVKSILGESSGLTLDEHTSTVLDALDGLVKRWGSVTSGRQNITKTFVNRLVAVNSNVSEMLTAVIEQVKALDATDPAGKDALAWEQSRHEANLRAIRYGDK